jgi:hypothetical protein
MLCIGTAKGKSQGGEVDLGHKERASIGVGFSHEEAVEGDAIVGRREWQTGRFEARNSAYDRRDPRRGAGELLCEDDVSPDPLLVATK